MLPVNMAVMGGMGNQVVRNMGIMELPGVMSVMIGRKMMNKEENYLKGIEHEMDVGYSQFKDRKKHNDSIITELMLVEWFGENMEKKRIINETRLFDFDGLFVEVTLPRGEFDGK